MEVETMNRQRMLAEEGIGKLLLKLSVPAMIGMLVQALSSLAEALDPWVLRG